MRARNVKCPNCGVLVTVSPVWLRGKGFIHYAQGQHILGMDRMPGDVSIEAVTYQGAQGWALCECVSCQRLYVLVEVSGKVQAVYPVARRPIAQEIPDPVRAAFEDALLCMATGALGGCLMMCRTTLIRIQRDQGVSGLEELKDRGKISPLLFQQANEVRHWANMVGHEDIPLEELTAQDCEELVDYMESLLDAIYVQPAKLQKYREARKRIQGK